MFTIHLRDGNLFQKLHGHSERVATHKFPSQLESGDTSMPRGRQTIYIFYSVEIAFCDASSNSWNTFEPSTLDRFEFHEDLEHLQYMFNKDFDMNPWLAREGNVPHHQNLSFPISALRFIVFDFVLFILNIQHSKAATSVRAHNTAAMLFKYFFRWGPGNEVFTRRISSSPWDFRFYNSWDRRT